MGVSALAVALKRLLGFLGRRGLETAIGFVRITMLLNVSSGWVNMQLLIMNFLSPKVSFTMDGSCQHHCSITTSWPGCGDVGNFNRHHSRICPCSLAPKSPSLLDACVEQCKTQMCDPDDDTRNGCNQMFNCPQPV